MVLCVSLKGGTGLFGGGDQRCLPRKGTAHCLRARSPGEVIRKSLLKPVRMVKKSECVKNDKCLGDHVRISDQVLIL